MTKSPSTSTGVRRGWIALCAAGLALVVSGCTAGTGKVTPAAATTATTPSSSSVAASGSASASPSASIAGTSVAPGAPVHVRLLESDGVTFGVGMPIVAYFDKKVTDVSGFVKSTTVQVNGAPAGGAWFFEVSGAAGEVIEAHYRPQNYWPAHARITMDMPVQGISAGPGLTFDDSLTLSIATGAANISYVDGATERMTVTSDGATVKTMPVSLGKAATPTFTGTKIAMEKDNPEHMIGTTPGDRYDLQVPYSVRFTNSGEFVHAASWNGGNIGQHSTSNGCTNLNPADAQWFFDFTRIGDVVLYTNTGGAGMPVDDGYGDWNVAWSTWLTGGVLNTIG